MSLYGQIIRFTIRDQIRLNIYKCRQIYIELDQYEYKCRQIAHKYVHLNIHYIGQIWAKLSIYEGLTELPEYAAIDRMDYICHMSQIGHYGHGLGVFYYSYIYLSIYL